MNRYAVINKAGLVQNVIIWDGETLYDPGPDVTLRKLADGERADIEVDLSDARYTADERIDALIRSITNAVSIADLKTKVAADPVLDPVEPAGPITKV